MKDNVSLPATFGADKISIEAALMLPNSIGVEVGLPLLALT